MNVELLKAALSEIGLTEDKSSPSWPYDLFEVRYGEIRNFAAEVVADCAKLEHRVFKPESSWHDLACAYIVVLDQWRRSQNTAKALMKSRHLTG